MKIIIHEDPNIKETEVVINCAIKDSAVQKMVSVISSFDMKVPCYKAGELFQLEVGNILYAESVDRRTFLYTQSDVFETEKRLYELEDYLKDHAFFRTSKAIIVNLQRVRSLRPELGARLLLTMDNGEKIIASRQYAGKIKEALEVK